MKINNTQGTCILILKNGYIIARKSTVKIAVFIHYVTSFLCHGCIWSCFITSYCIQLRKIDRLKGPVCFVFSYAKSLTSKQFNYVAISLYSFIQVHVHSICTECFADKLYMYMFILYIFNGIMSTLHYKQLLARRELHTYLHYICSHVQCSHAVCGSGIHTRIAVNQEVKKCGHLIFLLCITVCLFLDNGMDWSFIHIVESIRIYFRVVLQQSDDMLKVGWIFLFSTDNKYKVVSMQFSHIHKLCDDRDNPFPYSKCASHSSMHRRKQISFQAIKDRIKYCRIVWELHVFLRNFPCLALYQCKVRELLCTSNGN